VVGEKFVDNIEKKSEKIPAKPDFDPEACPNFHRVADILERAEGGISSVPEIQSALDAFAGSRELTILVSNEVKRLADGGGGHQPTNWSHLTLYQDEKFELIVESLQPFSPAGFLVTAATSKEMRVVGKGAIEFTVYRIPAETEMATLDKTIRPEFIEKKLLTPDAPGASVHLLDIVDIGVLSPSITIVLSERSRAPFTWSFDRESLEPLMVSASQTSLTRFRTLVDLIAAFQGTEFQSPAAEEFLLQLGDHELHFLRWRACQALAKINLSKARPLLTRLADDPHPQIKRLAAVALQRISEPTLAGQD
jgi:hypothetical protein